MTRFYILIVAAAAAISGYQAIVYSGVTKERARVEEQGKKIHAKAAEVRKKVEAKKPSEISADLRRYCLDC